MRVDVTIPHISKYEKVAERQLKSAANRWTKKNWGKPVDECNYQGMGWTIQGHVEFAQFRTGLCCSVFQPGTESVVIVLNEVKS